MTKRSVSRGKMIRTFRCRAAAGGETGPSGSRENHWEKRCHFGIPSPARRCTPERQRPRAGAALTSPCVSESSNAPLYRSTRMHEATSALPPSQVDCFPLPVNNACDFLASRSAGEAAAPRGGRARRPCAPLSKSLFSLHNVLNHKKTAILIRVDASCWDDQPRTPWSPRQEPQVGTSTWEAKSSFRRLILTNK